MMEPWQAIFEEDAFGRLFTFLQRGEDLGTREPFEFKLSDEIEDPDFERPIDQLMVNAQHEAARRNANEERAAIARKIGNVN